MSTEKDKRNVAIGEVVRHFREKRGLTKAELSRVSGASIASLQNIENGSTSPSMATIRKLAAALRIPVRQLLVGE